MNKSIYCFVLIVSSLASQQIYCFSESAEQQEQAQPSMTRTQAILLTALGVTLVAATFLASYKLVKDISQQSARIAQLNDELLLQGVLPATVKYSGDTTLAVDGRMRQEIVYLSAGTLVDEETADRLASDLLYYKGLNKMATYVRATAGAAVGMFLTYVGLAQLYQDEPTQAPASTSIYA